MGEIDPPLAVQPVKALHHIIRLTRPGDQAFSGGKPSTFTPGDQRGHGPHPGFLCRVERFRLGSGLDLDGVRDQNLLACERHKVRFRFNFRRE